MRAAALLAAALLVSGFLIAYHPHPFGWGAHGSPGGSTGGSWTDPGYGP